MGYVWIMYGIRMVYVCNIHAKAYVWNDCGIGMELYGICEECVCTVCGIRVEYECNIYAMCMPYVWDMYGICIEYVWHMYGICVDYHRICVE